MSVSFFVMPSDIIYNMDITTILLSLYIYIPLLLLFIVFIYHIYIYKLIDKYVLSLNSLLVLKYYNISLVVSYVLYSIYVIYNICKNGNIDMLNIYNSILNNELLYEGKEFSEMDKPNIDNYIYNMSNTGDNKDELSNNTNEIPAEEKTNVNKPGVYIDQDTVKDIKKGMDNLGEGLDGLGAGIAKGGSSIYDAIADHKNTGVGGAIGIATAGAIKSSGESAATKGAVIAGVTVGTKILLDSSSNHSENRGSVLKASENYSSDDDSIPSPGSGYNINSSIDDISPLEAVLNDMCILNTIIIIFIMLLIIQLLIRYMINISSDNNIYVFINKYIPKDNIIYKYWIKSIRGSNTMLIVFLLLFILIFTIGVLYNNLELYNNIDDYVKVYNYYKRK